MIKKLRDLLIVSGSGPFASQLGGPFLTVGLVRECWARLGPELAVSSPLSPPSLPQPLPRPPTSNPPTALYLTLLYFLSSFWCKEKNLGTPKQLSPKDPFSPTLPYPSIPSMPFQTMRLEIMWTHCIAGLQMKPKADVFSFFSFLFFKTLMLVRIMF